MEKRLPAMQIFLSHVLRNFIEENRRQGTRPAENLFLSHVLRNFIEDGQSHGDTFRDFKTFLSHVLRNFIEDRFGMRIIGTNSNS